MLAVRYLVAYDIADPKRLHRVARFLERRALRFQKSVFLFEGDDRAVADLLDDMTPLLDLELDCVQAWKLVKEQATQGWTRGTSASLHPASVVLYAAKPLFVENNDP